MGSFTVLRDVGDTLKNLFSGSIPELSDENSIVFDSPADIESSTTTRLAVYLYQITSNRYMLNSPREPVSENRMQYPPYTADLYYLFTPYGQTRETELIITEQIIQIFHDNAVLKGTLLSGNLKTSGNTELRVVPNNLTLDGLNKLWSIFPNKPLKLSLSYIVTPLRIPSERIVDITKASEKKIVMYRKEENRNIILEE